MSRVVWKIKTIVYVVLSVSALLVVGIGVFHFINIRQILRERIFAELNYALMAKQEVVETYLKGFEYEAKILADVFAIKLSEKKPDVPEMTRLLTATAGRASEIAHIDLITPDGMVLSSSDPAKVGEDKREKATYKEGKKGLFFNNLHLSSGGKRPAFGVSMPVMGEDEQLLGVVLVDVNADKLYQIIRDVTSFGEWGEIYLINKDKLLVSPSRYLTDSFLKKKIEVENVVNCGTHGHDTHKVGWWGDDASYMGLSGSEVLGSHTYMVERGWCMVAEVDKGQLLGRPIGRLLIISAAMLGATLTVFGLIALLILRLVVKPIQALHQGIVQITQGQFGGKVMIDSSNEIGDLARAFNQMSDKLTNYYSDLEREVTEKTGKLQDEVKVRREAEVKLEESVAELKKMNSFMVDRENKMMDLKREIAELKQK